MSTGVSCQTWLEAGILSRSMHSYGELSKRAGHGILFTYTDDIQAEQSLINEYSKHLLPISVLQKSFSPKFRYRHLLSSFFYPRIPWSTIPQCDLFRTTQIAGSWLARSLAKRQKVPFVLRAGYLWSDSAKVSEQGLRSNRFIHKAIVGYERKLCEEADHIIVSANSLKRSIHKRYYIPCDKIQVIGTPIDTKVFRPISNTKKKRDVLLVGRLIKLKNYREAIIAIGKLGLKATIVGQGNLENELKELAYSAGANIQWIKRIENEKLPNLMAEHRYYLLASTREGCSKSLLEALSCGMVCIVNGIKENRDLVEDRVNGFVCGESASAIKSCFKKVLAMKDIEKISSLARRFILENHELGSSVSKEISLYKNLLENISTR